MKSRRLRGFCFWLVDFSFVAILAAILLYLFCPQPELTSYTHYSTAVFDKKGKLLKLSLTQDDKYRLYQDIEQVSDELLTATILYEDQDFYQHAGVDFIALFRAFFSTYILQERRIGASTIVMQVARLRWNISSHTLSGKIEQIVRALQLSRHYSKKQLLNAYLNMAPYGGNIEGIGAASLIYFNKRPFELSLPEVLTLAVIPQNPNQRNPAKVHGQVKLNTARNNLWQRWLIKYPEDKKQEKYLSMTLAVRSVKELPKLAPHFVQYILNNQPHWQHGIINSTLDINQQRQLEKGIKSYVSAKADIGINNAAAVLLNYQTMEIEAMVGSADFYNNQLQGQVNGTTAKRSPGSTLKPFVYGLAIDEGLIHPMSLLKDAPRQYGGFSPENYDKKFLGPIVAKQALIQSRNVPAVELQAQLSTQSFYQFLQQAEITELKDSNYYGLALALGGGELTMLELVRLYSMLANQGELKALKTEYTAGDNRNNKAAVGKQLLSAEASFLVLDMLKDNPAPNHLGLDTSYIKKNEIAWKTGTSWAFRDAWAIGVSGPYVLAVWVGNFNGKGNNAFVGRSAAGPLLFSLFNRLVENQGWQVADTVNLAELNVKEIAVCGNTGDLYQKYCPTKQMSWFIPGISPIKVSTVYRNIATNKDTGLRTCHQGGVSSQTNEQTQMQVFEFWPSDFLHIFNQAGISLKTPPKYEKNCSLDEKSGAGIVPKISSLQSNIDYVIQVNNQLNNLGSDIGGLSVTTKIPFDAIVDPDVEKVFWFVNGKYEGSAGRGQSFIWQATAGHFIVTAVDDAGRSTSKEINVVLI